MHHRVRDPAEALLKCIELLWLDLNIDLLLDLEPVRPRLQSQAVNQLLDLLGLRLRVVDLHTHHPNAVVRDRLVRVPWDNGREGSRGQEKERAEGCGKLHRRIDTAVYT